jgi:hypothetical protein
MAHVINKTGVQIAAEGRVITPMAKPKPIHSELAAERESYEWLEINGPHFFEAVNADFEAGCTPEEIASCILRTTCRPDIATRCRLAARYLQRQTKE